MTIPVNRRQRERLRVHHRRPMLGVSRRAPYVYGMAEETTATETTTKANARRKVTLTLPDAWVEQFEAERQASASLLNPNPSMAGVIMRRLEKTMRPTRRGKVQ